MSDNIQTNTTERLTPCLQLTIDKTRYLVEVHFSDTSTQSVEGLRGLRLMAWVTKGFASATRVAQKGGKV